jgi:hypothetical protein
MKVSNILLGGLVFLLVGCGTTGGEPGDGLPNGGMLEIPQNVQGQGQNQVNNKDETLVGAWNIYFRDTNNKIQSYIWEFNTNANVYLLNQNNKQKIATVSVLSNTKIQLTANNQTETIEFKNKANDQGDSCYYTNRVFSDNSNREELWCKKSSEQYSNENWNNNNQGDMRPTLIAPEGNTVALKDFLYPSTTLNTGTKVTENVYIYEQNQYVQQATKTFERTIDAQQNKIIKESFMGIKEDVIYDNNKIVSYDQLNSGGYTSEEYPYNVQKNSKITEVNENGINMICVIKDIVPGFKELSYEIPQEIINDFENRGSASASRLTYLNVMHIHCGTNNGQTIDSYNASGWGEVLTIIKKNDGETRYEILDKNSMQY